MGESFKGEGRKIEKRRTYTEITEDTEFAEKRTEMGCRCYGRPHP
jgi:hypothetical protein